MSEYSFGSESKTRFPLDCNSIVESFILTCTNSQNYATKSSQEFIRQYFKNKYRMLSWPLSKYFPVKEKKICKLEPTCITMRSTSEAHPQHHSLPCFWICNPKHSTSSPRPQTGVHAHNKLYDISSNTTGGYSGT